MPAQIDLSIIIVNWKSAAYVQQCLASIAKYTSGANYEVVVIDNASYDGCDEIISTRFPSAKFIQSQENVGFAKANNLAVGHSTGRNLLFLNPDTEVLDAALQNMVAFLESHPHAGIVGARLLNSDLSVQTSCIQRFPTILNQMLDSDWLRQLFPRSSVWGTRPLYDRSDRPAFPVQVISGAGLMIKREAFEAVGHFTTAYFMYAEDVDLCYQVKEAGWDVIYLPTAEIVHHGGQSSNQSSEEAFSAIVMRESIFRFFRRTSGALYARLFCLAVSLNACLRLLMLGLSLLSPFPRNNRRRLRKTFERWWRILRWSIGLEQWATTLSTSGFKSTQVVQG